MEQHGSLIAHDVTAKNPMVGRDEEFAEAVFFFDRAAFGGIGEWVARREVGLFGALQLIFRRADALRSRAW